MEFIKPIRYESLDIKVTDETLVLLKYYSKYCNMTIDNVIEEFLQNLKEDENFIEFVKKERHNKKISRVLGIKSSE